MSVITLLLCLGGATQESRSGQGDTNRVIRKLSAEELFRKLSPSVFVVKTLDPADPPGKQGSAVVIGPNLLVTNFHVVEDAARVVVLHNGMTWTVKHVSFDREHDLALLDVDGVAAPAVVPRFSDLAVGERVYAIGAPEGLELSLSEGMISGLRQAEGEIQTTAPISPGSSGGGLFDATGRLVGVTTASVTEGQNLNFAVPSKWVALLWSRAVPGSESNQDSEMDFSWRRPFNDVPCLFNEMDEGYAKEDLSAGQYGSAIDHFELILDCDTENEPAWRDLGFAYLGLRQFAKAIGAEQQALDLKSRDLDAWLYLGMAESDLGDCPGALKAYRKLKELAPTSAASLAQYSETCNLTAY